MMAHASCLFFLLLIFLRASATVAAATPAAYNATDFILLSCGNSTSSYDDSNRSWSGDEHSRYMPSNAANVSSTVSLSDSAFVSAPYRTARVFHSPFTYTFPLSTGQKFLRIYFYPHFEFNSFKSFFSLTANAFTLLSNFSVFLYTENTRVSTLVREFVVNVGSDQRLDLTFSPNPNSFAFVSGIEIVSMPDALYFRGTAVKYADGVFDLRNDTALENLYRLDVGDLIGVGIQEDSGMFRAWSPDREYIAGGKDIYVADSEDVQIKYTDRTPPYTAPALVYTSASQMEKTDVGLEWLFPVDSGFFYLLRLHFCEFTEDVRAQNQRVFTVSINYKMLEFEADVIKWTGGPDIPIFRDYITWVPDADSRRRRQDLRLSLFPNLERSRKLYSALLNGLEIFKLSDSNRSLAAANLVLAEDSPDEPPVSRIPSQKINNKSSGSYILYASLGSAVGVLAVVAAVGFLIFRWRRSKVEDLTKRSWLSTASTSTATPSGSGFSIPSHLCSYFTIDEIKSATRNFDSNSIIGKGGFGNVYKGLVNRGATTVAIKRLHPSSNQGVREFLTEIEMLSKLRHLHLVSLSGYCNDGDEMILVYDYMAHGTLRDHLYNSDNPPLKWEQRLQICLGAAKGLHFLHNGAQHAIIHRDVKSTNILLDEAWVAKISDFGLSKMGQGNDSFTHISTNVKGTFGYLDPKYMSSHRLTRKSDVYAFGVVLFEVLSGRAAVDITLDEEQHSLASWARYCIRKGEVDRLIDPNLMGQISPACFKVYVGIAGRCVHIQPLERPTMADVVMGLELALTMQQTTDSARQKEDDANDQSNEAISMHGITATIEYNPSSSIRNSQSEG